MKKLIIFLVIIVTANSFCQTPQLMSYQAVIRNDSGILITNTTIGIKISILQGSTSGNTVFSETQNPTTNVNGLISLQIGNGTLISGSISGINWANGEYYVKTETDPLGGANYTIIGTSQLLSVPYAFYASNTNNTIVSNSGVFSRPLNFASNIQIIPHGLGAIPAKVKITAKWLPYTFNSGNTSESIGIYEKSSNTTSTIWSKWYPGSFASNNSSNSDIISIYDGPDHTLINGQTATINVDEANIILTWTLHGLPASSPIQVLWEATK